MASWSVIAIDTHVDGEEGGQVGGRGTRSPARTSRAFARAFRRRDRSSSAAAARYAVARFGLYRQRSRHCSTFSSDDARVKAYVCGHVHQETATSHRGLQLLTTPSTCFQFVAGTPTFLRRCDAARMALARSRRRRYPHVPRGSCDRLCGDARPIDLQKTLRDFSLERRTRL